MLKRLTICAAICATCATAQVPGEVPFNYTAEAMLELCNGDDPTVSEDTQSLVCTFRLQGAVDIMTANCQSRGLGFDPMPRFSAGPVPSTGAARQAFRNYMADHPDVWRDYWSSVVARAISAAFPCKP